jgi:hypothetical protein
VDLLRILSVLFVAVHVCGLFGCSSGQEERPSSTRERGIVYSEEREPCSHFNPLRNLYFGDLHVHTGLSHETWLLDVPPAPEEAYRFARGEPIRLPPLDERGIGTRVVSIDEPLDFAAVTDHGEFLAEVRACITPDSGAYDSLTCAIYREKTFLSEALVAFPTFLTDPVRSKDICRPGRTDCPRLAAQVWESLQEAAEEAYDRTSQCAFTSFVGYEHTGLPFATNMHRNVIFRNASVPPLPISYFEAPTPEELWEELRRQCLEERPGCDVLAIPHNSNESNGNKFLVGYPRAHTLEEEREWAAFRARMEPLAEIFQHKGDSECMNGLSGVSGPEDEMCEFEKIRRAPFTDCGEGRGAGGILGEGCVSRLDFIRDVLVEGLAEEERLGANPYKLGIIASTDTHNATPGMVAEDLYPGHWGIKEDTPEKRLARGGVTHQGLIANPGGLAAVWAVENSRDAIFEALRRRETYGTSGPRIVVRFFGGWEYPATMCDDPDFVRKGYLLGVPMGGDLPSRPPGAAAPRFAVLAHIPDARPHRVASIPIQRIQIVKGWIDPSQEPVAKGFDVFEVAGDPGNGAGVDLETCEPFGQGFARLCVVWSDPDFHPERRAFYYARVVLNPSCRWSSYECARLSPGERPQACQDPDVEKVIQERAWTSPIWYAP